MTKKSNWQTGQKGELIAKNFLLKKGYKIITTNFRLRFGEIDLIVTKGKKLIFVEVKLKVGTRFGSPEEMINRRKISQIKKIGSAFLKTHPTLAAAHPSRRIDAVCIVIDSHEKIHKINHYQNIEPQV